MLPIIVKIIIGLSLAISSFYIIKNLIKSDVKLFEIHNFSLLFLLLLPTVCFLDIKYNMLVSLLTYILSVIVFKKIFNLSVSDSILLCSFVNILVAVVDGALSLIEVNFITYEQARLNWYITVVNNILISSLSYLASCLSVFQRLFKNIRKKANEKHQIMNSIFVVIIVIIVAGLYININYIFKLNLYYTITIISVIVFFLLYCCYIMEKNQYDKLNDEYNILFDYVQNFENWIDDEQLYRHELKNNLSILREIVKEKEAIRKIDDMLKINIIVDDQYIQQLKNVPKGGLKGLLYYKVAIAENNHVQMLAEVSPKVTEFIEKLPQKELKQLCILLGIYLDNAIEAASKTTKKLVALEIYELKDKLQFVVSNTYDQEIALDKINDKGYSTKGRNRGNGLYFAKKLIGKNKNMSSENILLNGYYIQKLLINIVEQ